MEREHGPAGRCPNQALGPRRLARVLTPRRAARYRRGPVRYVGSRSDARRYLDGSGRAAGDRACRHVRTRRRVPNGSSTSSSPRSSTRWCSRPMIGQVSSVVGHAADGLIATFDTTTGRRLPTPDDQTARHHGRLRGSPRGCRSKPGEGRRRRHDHEHTTRELCDPRRRHHRSLSRRCARPDSSKLRLPSGQGCLIGAGLDPGRPAALRHSLHDTTGRDRIW